MDKIESDDPHPLLTVPTKKVLKFKAEFNDEPLHKCLCCDYKLEYIIDTSAEMLAIHCQQCYEAHCPRHTIAIFAEKQT